LIRIDDLRGGPAQIDPRREGRNGDHYHAVVWIDHKQARVIHFNVEEADRTVIRDHIVREIHPREKRTGRRIEENKTFFEDIAKAIADAGATLIVGPAQEKYMFAKFLAEKHPAIRTHVEGVEKVDHPTDRELLDFARRYVKAADRMRPQINPSEPRKPIA
jgi:hypothetical protein